MRKLFILFILFSMSLLLQQLGLLTDAHHSVLLAIGLVILSAYTLSEIGSSLKLPRVTGYILTGLLLGPYALEILSEKIVSEIEMFNTLAIGLIAVTAGLELHFSSLKKVSKRSTYRVTNQMTMMVSRLGINDTALLPMRLSGSSTYPNRVLAIPSVQGKSEKSSGSNR